MLEEKTLLVYPSRNYLHRKQCPGLFLVFFCYGCFTYTQDIDQPFLELSKRSITSSPNNRFQKLSPTTFDNSKIICSSVNLLVVFVLCKFSKCGQWF